MENKYEWPDTPGLEPVPHLQHFRVLGYFSQVSSFSNLDF